MKKFTFILVMMFGLIGFTMAQTIENFESLKFTVFSEGSTGKVGVVPNPDPTGINTSVNVGMMVRAADGDPWQGFFHDFTTPVVISGNKYLHLKLWKPRTSPIVVKYEKQGNPDAGDTGDTHPMTAQADSNMWEEFVFDMTAYSGTVIQRLTIIPDFPLPAVGLSTDINIYFDDIYLNNDPAVGSAPVIMLENFETIPMHPYSEEGTFTLIDNPDKSGINTSDHVCDFMRTVAAPDWAGFYSTLAAAGYDSVDVTTNKYVHVKAWKPRISEVKFKLEAGAAGTLEIASMNPQTKIKAWQDFVFDFSSKTGKYPTLGLSLDAGAAALTDPIHIYFDDIMVSDNPNPMVAVTFNVDMTNAGLTAGQKVYVAGNFTGWAVPDTQPQYELTDANSDNIYTITLAIPAGDLAFKFFKGGSGWDGGEWAGDPNRTLTVAGDTAVTAIWGTNGFVNTRENPLAGKIKMYPNPVRSELTVNSTADLRSVVISSTVGKVVGKFAFNNSGTQTINTSNLSNGIYFVTFVGKDGNQVTQKLIKR